MIDRVACTGDGDGAPLPIFTSTTGEWDCLFEMHNCECVAAGLRPVLRVAGDKV